MFNQILAKLIINNPKLMNTAKPEDVGTLAWLKDSGLSHHYIKQLIQHLENGRSIGYAIAEEFFKE